MPAAAVCVCVQCLLTFCTLPNTSFKTWKEITWNEFLPGFLRWLSYCVWGSMGGVCQACSIAHSYLLSTGKVLIIGGGIANFTNVAATFKVGIKVSLCRCVIHSLPPLEYVYVCLFVTSLQSNRWLPLLLHLLFSLTISCLCHTGYRPSFSGIQTSVGGAQDLHLCASGRSQLSGGVEGDEGRR